MPDLTDSQRQHIIELLERGEDLPLDYKHLLFPPERQEYELVYAGKEREEGILAETMGVPLQPIKTFGNADNGGQWENLLIFGDNLQAMKTLLRMKEEGKLVNADGSRGVKLVYIDPPFATKQEFRGGTDEKAYQDKIIGARFIEFLRKRLVLLRELLSSDGSLFLHLDTKKSHYLKVLLDEVFGEANFRNEIIWKRQSAHNDAGRCGAIHDSILFYTKSDCWIWNDVRMPVSEDYVQQFFNQADASGRRYARGDLTAPGVTREGDSGKPWRGIDVSAKGRHWAIPGDVLLRHGIDPELSIQQKLDALDKADAIHWPKKGVPRLKRFADEVDGVSLQDVWADIKLIHNQSSERVGYPTQKPEALAERIILSSSTMLSYGKVEANLARPTWF